MAAQYRVLAPLSLTLRSKDGSDIHGEIFEDRISIFGPGGLHAGLQLDELRHDNYRYRLRNKLVAEGFYLTTAIEKYGSGSIRIRDALRDYPEIRCDLEEISGGFSVTFVRESSPSGGVNEPAALFSLIQNRPGLKASELVQLTGNPQRTIERWLQQLKASGQIEFRGAPKTGGYHVKH